MHLIFENPVTLEGGTLDGVIDVRYARHYTMPLLCVDTEGNDVDMESKGMHQWRVMIAPDEVCAPLIDCRLPMPAGNKLQLEIPAYAPDLFSFIAGRTDVPAVLRICGYSEADNPEALVYKIQLPMLLSCNSDIFKPIDIQAALLEELTWAVTVVTGDSADVAEEAAKALAAAIAAEASMQVAVRAAQSVSNNTDIIPLVPNETPADITVPEAGKTYWIKLDRDVTLSIPEIPEGRLVNTFVLVDDLQEQGQEPSGNALTGGNIEIVDPLEAGCVNLCQVVSTVLATGVSSHRLFLIDSWAPEEEESIP